MTSIIYYIANFGLKDKLKVFYLFSMSTGKFGDKHWLYILAAVLVAAGFAYRKFVKER